LRRRLRSFELRPSVHSISPNTSTIFCSIRPPGTFFSNRSLPVWLPSPCLYPEEGVVSSGDKGPGCVWTAWGHSISKQDLGRSVSYSANAGPGWEKSVSDPKPLPLHLYQHLPLTLCVANGGQRECHPKQRGCPYTCAYLLCRGTCTCFLPLS
jgi:hypothetical protein